MGRSSQEQARQNRAKIVEAATRMFRQHGTGNVSVADIMAELGMTTGGFYKHFASKDVLIAETFDLAFEQSVASWQRVSKREHDNPEDRANALVRHYFQKRPPEQTCPMLAFAPHAAGAASGDEAVMAYANGAQGLYEHFLDHMRACQSTGSEQDAKVLFAAMIGARLLAQSTGDADWVRSMQVAVQEAAANER
jgi:TetR/AcrR family transcriptional regulator, transcriptional repressor for nem operon